MIIRGATKESIIENYSRKIMLNKEELEAAMNRCDKGEEVILPLFMKRKITVTKTGDNCYTLLIAFI